MVFGNPERRLSELFFFAAFSNGSQGLLSAASASAKSSVLSEDFERANRDRVF